MGRVWVAAAAPVGWQLLLVLLLSPPSCCNLLDVCHSLSLVQPAGEVACVGRRRACVRIRCTQAPSGATVDLAEGLVACKLLAFRPVVTPRCPFASGSSSASPQEPARMAPALCSVQRAALGSGISPKPQDARSRRPSLRVQAVQQGGDDLSRKFAEAARKMNVKLPEVEAQNVATQAPPRCPTEAAPPPLPLAPAACGCRGRVAVGAGRQPSPACRCHHQSWHIVQPCC